jgi:outer membrane protein assembly factor BamE (lipoprotein component of BamABCDE complex)
MNMNKKRTLILLSAAALLVPVSCTPTVAQRGNMLEDYQMKTIIPGIHTRSDVLRILGSPTTQAPFDDNTWYYIGQETEKHGILDPEITKERVVQLTFNEDGTVAQLKELPKGSRIDVPIERSKTPTQGNETSITQEFFGNLGRFNTKGKESATKGGGDGYPGD